MTFEEALERLRQITEKMEDPGMPLAELSSLYKEGRELYRVLSGGLGSDGKGADHPDRRRSRWNSMNFLAQEQPRLEKALWQAVSHRGHYEARVWEAMEYSLMAGGKRIRPLMLELAAWAASGRQKAMEEVRPFAVALEMIHTYSLIHDDLPAMDNDDYRRGRLTNHKVYGEGMAVLAGDGLLNLAYETMLDAVIRDPRPGRIQAAATIAHAAGPLGMVAGQTADILAEEGRVTEEYLEYKRRIRRDS